MEVGEYYAKALEEAHRGNFVGAGYLLARGDAKGGDPQASADAFARVMLAQSRAEKAGAR